MEHVWTSDSTIEHKLFIPQDVKVFQWPFWQDLESITSSPFSAPYELLIIWNPDSGYDSEACNDLKLKQDQSLDNLDGSDCHMDSIYPLSGHGHVHYRSLLNNSNVKRVSFISFFRKDRTYMINELYIDIQTNTSMCFLKTDNNRTLW